VWLERNGGKISTLDLFGRGFVLLAGPEGSAWREAACPGVHVVQIGETAFPDAYGIPPSGAVLVRPDGFVAWRGESAQDLSDALSPLLS
jgi:putative polyketide hydroxylase